MNGSNGDRKVWVLWSGVGSIVERPTAYEIVVIGRPLPNFAGERLHYEVGLIASLNALLSDKSGLKHGQYRKSDKAQQEERDYDFSKAEPPVAQLLLHLAILPQRPLSGEGALKGTLSYP